MADEVVATPKEDIIHEPPSLPASPLPKRTKIIDPISRSDNATPTPINPFPSTTAASTTTATPLAPSTMTDSTHSTTVAPLSAEPPLLVKKLTPKARTPTRGSAFAAGYDLYAAEPTLIPSRGKALISTALSLSIPLGCYGRVAPRSGLASKHSIDVGAGVIDADYRGEVKVLLFNFGEEDFEVREGERVAQLVLERCYTPEVVVVEELEESVRGVGGFGSTGL